MSPVSSPQLSALRGLHPITTPSPHWVLGPLCLSKGDARWVYAHGAHWSYRVSHHLEPVAKKPGRVNKVTSSATTPSARAPSSGRWDVHEPASQTAHVYTESGSQAVDGGLARSLASPPLTQVTSVAAKALPGEWSGCQRRNSCQPGLTGLPADTQLVSGHGRAAGQTGKGRVAVLWARHPIPGRAAVAASMAQSGSLPEPRGSRGLS